jgi:hypothetical protein
MLVGKSNGKQCKEEKTLRITKGIQKRLSIEWEGERKE